MGIIGKLKHVAAVHNPAQLKKKIDGVFGWAVSRS
jgi:hypothetical protein